MYTDPDHLRVDDPGKVEGNVVFAYLDGFYGDKEELAALKAHYQKGGLGDMKIKKLLNDCLQTLLAPIREARAALKASDIKNLLEAGTKKARIEAQKTMDEVRSAIGFIYFKED